MPDFKNRYFSVGEYCATAHQIRRVCGGAEAHFFDWLVTRGESFRVVGPAAPDTDAPLLSGDWSVVDRGLRLLDADSGLLFQHEFTINTSKAVDPAHMTEHLPVARQKFSYLRTKLRATLADCTNGVMIRAENGIVDLAGAEQRLAQLRDVFGGLQPRLKYVLASTQLRQESVSSEHLCLRLANPVPPNGPDAWKGDNASWDRLFEMAEAHLG